MARHPTGALRDLQGGQRAVGRDPAGTARLDCVEERLRDLQRQLEILPLEAPRAVDRRALLDDRDLGAGMAPSTSADLRPMFCARRWHGTWYAIGPGRWVKFVSSVPSARSRARSSNTSRVREATSLASSDPSSHGYSCFSM